MRIFWFYQSFIVQNKVFIAAAVAFGVLNNFVGLLLPLSLGRFYELIYQGKSNKGFILDSLGLVFGKNFESFMACFLFLTILKGIAEFLNAYVRDIIEEKFVFGLRTSVFQQQFGADYETHQRKPIGKYLSRYIADFGNIRKGLSGGIITFFADVVFCVMAFFFLFSINHILTLVLIIGLALNLIILSFTEHHRKKILIQKQNSKASYNHFILERLQGFLTIKIFGRERIEQKRFLKKTENINEQNLHYSQIKSLEKALIPTGIYLVVAMVLFSIFRLYEPFEKRFEAGYFIAFVLLIFSLRPILRRFLKVEMYWNNAAISIQNLIRNREKTREKLPKFDFDEGHIKVKHLCFAYPDSEKRIFDNVSFEARQNQITRITGKSGAGKSTFFRLLTKLYSVSHGVIFIDGQNIQMVSGIRKYIGLISDEIPLLGNTIFETIVETRTEESREQATQLLERLNGIFLLKQPLSLDKKIRNNGENLSQNERKLLVLARAIISEKPILLFDEPFAGLSDNSAYFLGLFINELKKDRTILVISSRICEGIEYDKLIDIEKESIGKTKVYT